MSPFEYVLALIAVIVGLAITDLAVSVHRLLRARRRVRWDWLPFATALLAVLSLLEVWWVLFGTQEAAFFTTLGAFLPVAGQLFLLFLLNAAALPDEVPQQGLDLRRFYGENASYFFSLFAAYLILVMVVRIMDLLSTPVPDSNLIGALAWLVVNMLLLGLMLTLARVRARWLHAVAVPGLLILFLAQWWGLQLG